ncbi:OLC1v1038926C1 [Oldenlandia corymbosa var. corymbosa]|uniref:OLC1v1038926C1 n=1 Tax=Oldenlandia corymbosa var. corymbosa TaxID=529605 RepID=A0AAV1D1V1_OLDCO|nr:OLC1v1038926C1 [Oldenlandia corymbosa var. corymbosa]
MSLRERRVTSNPDSNNTPESSETLIPSKTPSNVSPSFYQRALQTTAHLSNLLPTGTLLAFQLLTPIATNNGSCDAVTRSMTSIILIVLGLSCFLACFTDSFKATDGQVYYGFATRKGLFVFDYPAASASGLPGDLSKYRLNFIDVIHAVLSVLVFVAVALRDKNVVGCFYPAPEKETQEVLDIVPVSIGLICSLLFMIFPTRRHGIGFPVTSD